MLKKILKRKGPVAVFVLRVFYRLGLMEASFYARAFVWHLTHRVGKRITIDEAYRYFYLSFLRVPPDKIEIIRKTDKSITTASFHDCPVLSFAEIIGEDTRKVCLGISKGPCDYFIRKLGGHIRFESDYFQIRPHCPKCIETIRLSD